MRGFKLKKRANKRLYRKTATPRISTKKLIRGGTRL